MKKAEPVLPEIPNKTYFSIGEAAELCGVKEYVLRYWETEFPQLRPIKRAGNRRSYQRKDIELVRQIRTLLYGEGFTLAGARARLAAIRKGGEAAAAPAAAPAVPAAVQPAAPAAKGEGNSQRLVGELEKVCEFLRKPI